MATLAIMYNWHVIITNNKITFSVHQKKLIFQIPEMNYDHILEGLVLASTVA